MAPPQKKERRPARSTCGLSRSSSHTGGPSASSSTSRPRRTTHEVERERNLGNCSPSQQTTPRDEPNESRSPVLVSSGDEDRVPCRLPSDKRPSSRTKFQPDVRQGLGRRQPSSVLGESREDVQCEASDDERSISKSSCSDNLDSIGSSEAASGCQVGAMSDGMEPVTVMLGMREPAHARCISGSGEPSAEVSHHDDEATCAAGAYSPRPCPPRPDASNATGDGKCENEDDSSSTLLGSVCISASMPQQEADLEFEREEQLVAENIDKASVEGEATDAGVSGDGQSMPPTDGKNSGVEALSTASSSSAAASSVPASSSRLPQPKMHSKLAAQPKDKISQPLRGGLAYSDPPMSTIPSSIFDESTIWFGSIACVKRNDKANATRVYKEK